MEYNNETALMYMKANPYKNVLVRIKDGKKYTFDKDGTIRVNEGMWVYPTKIKIDDNEKWTLPEIK